MSPKLYRMSFENHEAEASKNDPTFARRERAITDKTFSVYAGFSTTLDHLAGDGRLRCAIVFRKGMSPLEFARELESVAAQLRQRKGRRIKKGNEFFTDEDLGLEPDEPDA